MRVEKSYRGINERLARHYLSNLGGETADGGSPGDDSDDGGDVVGDDWRASLSAETVSIGPSMQLTEVTVVFEGDEETLDEIVEDFSQKAMRAGG